MKQDNWKEYNGSDEQISELRGANNNFLLCYRDGQEVHWNRSVIRDRFVTDVLHNTVSYWITPDDPLRDMKVRQAQTGQPVWVRYEMQCDRKDNTIEIDETTEPDWSIPNAKYSFTPFDD